MLLRMSPKQFYISKKKVDAQTLVLKPNEPINNQKRINVTFDLYDAAMQKVHHDEKIQRNILDGLWTF